MTAAHMQIFLSARKIENNFSLSECNGVKESG